MTDIVRDEPAGIERFVDRYWFLVRGRGFRVGAGPRERGGPAHENGAPTSDAERCGTVVTRDGEFVVVSVEATDLGWPEGTLLFRFRSQTTPCVDCVDHAVAVANQRAPGRLTANDVRDMLRSAVVRCTAAGVDGKHGRPQAAPRPAQEGRGAPPAPTAERRHDAELWLLL